MARKPIRKTPAEAKRAAKRAGRRRRAKSAKAEEAEVEGAEVVGVGEPTHGAQSVGVPEDRTAQDGRARKGLICPRCHCADLRAADGLTGWLVTHTMKGRDRIRRRRICRHCGKVVFTTETIGGGR